MFAGKNILVGVTGGIAAYKTCDVVRELVKASAQVRVAMTESACRFVQPLTFETLTGQPVLTEMFPVSGGGTVHIDWARWPSAICVCPATANTISKIANGLADNVLTTTILATFAPVVICPAMNKEMYANPIYQENEKKLLSHGYRVVSPGRGELACGEVGWGRLAEKDEILDALKKTLLGGRTLQGKKVLITAGPTHEPLDPVRFLANRSSGKMGYALAEAAALQGAQVTLISGPVILRPFPDVRLIRVQTAQEMADATLSILKEYDIFISSAAVADFRPENCSSHKIKKERQNPVLSLVRTPDILETAAEIKDHRIHVGFSVETENETTYSQAKLKKKKLDLIVINNPLEKGAGFEVDTNIVTLLDAQGRIEKWPLMSKRNVAAKIIEKIVQMGSC